MSQNFMHQAPAAHANENPADEPIAMSYRGAFESGQRYGVQMNEALAMVFTIANEHAFRSLVCPQVAETQPRMIELTAYVPMAKTTIAKYLAPVLSVAQARTCYDLPKLCVYRWRFTPRVDDIVFRHTSDM